jgi:AcrR family transcriptional regulator
MLSEQHVVDAALRIVQRGGAEQLSMRALAKELGVTPMALYRYVPNKQALLDRVRDWALAMASSVSSRRKSSTPRSKSRLDLERIVDAGLRVAHREGIDALTMRAVAEELGVSTMALYHYVPDKETMLDRMRAHVVSQVPTPAPQARDWEAQMKAYVLASIRVLAPYPGLLRYGLARPLSKESGRLAGHGLAILLAAGFDERSAALAITTYHAHVLGMLLMQPMLQRQRATERARTVTKESPAGVPRAAQYLRDIEFLESIDYGIETMLSGLRLRLVNLRSKGAPPRV